MNSTRIRAAFVLLCSAWLMLGADDLTRTNAGFTIRVWETDDGLPQSSVLALAQTPDGYLWLGTLNGLVRFDGLRFEVFDPGNTPALDDSRIGKLMVDDAGTLWISTEGGSTVTLRDGKFFTASNAPPAFNANPAARVASFWNTNRFQQHHEGYPWGLRAPNAVTEDGDGNLIVGTRSGVFWLYRDGRIVQLSTDQGLSRNVVLSLLFDREETLWVGTDGGGLNRVRPRAFFVVPETRGWTINSLSEGKDETVWLATGSEGLVAVQNGMVRGYGPFAGANWRTVFVDRQQRVWLGSVGGNSGAWKFEADRFHPVLSGSRAAVPSGVSAIFQDGSGNIWFGTDGGLFRFNGTNWQTFTTKEGLTSDVITAIREDAQGTLWIGTRRGGINRFSNGKFSSIRKSDGAPSDDISALLIDSEGVVWATTAASGLGRFRGGRWTQYTSREGLASNSLGYMVDDERGGLWIGSTVGLLRVSKTALSDFADGKSASIRCRAYGKFDGLPTAECSSGAQPGALRARDGTLWFPTMKGVAFVHPAQLPRNTNSPLVVIQSVLVDNKPRSIEDGRSNKILTLGPRDGRLEIHFASLNLAAPERALCRYRLEGFEKDWIDADNSRVASYSKLPPGDYSFHVVAANEDGVWNDIGRRLAIVVQPPFWRTWWFIALVTLGAIASVARTVHYFSTQRLQRELVVLRQQEALEKERARIARDIHDQVGASLTQVALLGELVETDKESPRDIEEHAQQICQTARDTTRALDEIVWTVNPQNDTLEGLVNYICKYAQDYFAVAGVKYRLDVPSQLPATPIAPDVRHNVFLATKEAITNVVRHAKASAALVRMQLRETSFIVEIEDNGCGLAGMDHQRAKTRHGLSNMRQRLEEIGGSFVLGPGREGGAVVRLTVPLNKTHSRPTV